MKHSYSIEDLLSLYEEKGDGHYGEVISQTEHALQCAALAQKHGAKDVLVVAALLHDVGHLLADLQQENRFEVEIDDDGHEGLGARALAPIFGQEVARPVALHVMAKRWRCTTDPDYYEQLSPTSRASLLAQGGLLSPDVAKRFESHPGFKSAVALRTWDDEAKVEGVDAGKIRDYEDLLSRLASAR
jgi:phosphonate degradation associated HDIG domain protein